MGKALEILLGGFEAISKLLGKRRKRRSKLKEELKKWEDNGGR